MKSFRQIFAFIATSLILTGCMVEEEYSKTVDGYNSTVSSSSSSDSTISHVAIIASSKISYNAATTLTAVPVVSESITINYSWEITDGGDYASLASSTSSTTTLTANNTTSSEVTVKVKVTATNSSNSSDSATSEEYSITITKNGETVSDEVTSASIYTSLTTITCKGTSYLIAQPVYTGDPTLTYSWAITSGGEFASLSASSGTNVTLTGNNTTEENQSVVVQLSVSDGTNTKTCTVTITVAKNIITSVLYLNITDGKVSADNSEWFDIGVGSSNAVSFTNDTLSVKYTKDSGASTGLIKVDATSYTYATTLTVNISGTATTGGIKIQTNESDSSAFTTNVVLNGVTLTSSSYPCLDITKGGAANITLTGTNTFTDGRSYGTGYGEEYSTTSGSTYTDDGETKTCTVSKRVVSPGSDSKGTLFCKGNLTISGSGSLKITQGYKNCIATKEGLLTVNGGTFNLTSTAKNGLFGYTGVVVNGGTITFTGTGSISASGVKKANGIKADSDNTSGYATINGGTLTLTASCGKGISAPVINLAGGSTTITSSGTSRSSSSLTYYDADGVSTTETVKFSAEGIEGESAITVSGGSTVITADDDGVNVSSTSGGLLSITGGNIYVRSQGDGLDSNGNITISGGLVVVSQTGNGNSPIDCGDGYKFTVTGTTATVFAVGATGMFSETIPSSTSIPMIYSTSLSSLSTIGVSGIVGLKNPQSYGAALLVSPDLTSGTSYSFVGGGTLSGTSVLTGTSSDIVYFPATISGGSSTSATATTESSSSSGGQSSGNTPGPGGGSSSGPGRN